MLLLTRNIGQTIIINENIQVQVVRVTGGTVKLGITAPKDVTVDREEVHQRKMAERGEVSGNA